MEPTKNNTFYSEIEHEELKRARIKMVREKQTGLSNVKKMPWGYGAMNGAWSDEDIMMEAFDANAFVAGRM